MRQEANPHGRLDVHDLLQLPADADLRTADQRLVAAKSRVFTHRCPGSSNVTLCRRLLVRCADARVSAMHCALSLLNIVLPQSARVPLYLTSVHDATCSAFTLLNIKSSVPDSRKFNCLNTIPQTPPDRVPASVENAHSSCLSAVRTCAASLEAVFVHTQSLSCLARTLTTMPQISSPSVNCSPMHASSCAGVRAKKSGYTFRASGMAPTANTCMDMQQALGVLSCCERC